MDTSKPGVSEEVEWIERCQRGEREPFGLLAQKYRGRVFSMIFRLVGRRNEVEDLAQEIFIKAFVAIGSYNFQASFGTWLSQISVNHCYDFLRRERTSRVSFYGAMTEERQRELEAKLETPELGGLNSEQRLAMRDLVSRLLDRAPVQDRILLTLKELEDLSVEEIGAILKLKPSTVKVRLHRARKRMLRDLNRWQEGRSSHAL